MSSSKWLLLGTVAALAAASLSAQTEPDGDAILDAWPKANFTHAVAETLRQHAIAKGYGLTGFMNDAKNAADWCTDYNGDWGFCMNKVVRNGWWLGPVQFGFGYPVQPPGGADLGDGPDEFQYRDANGDFSEWPIGDKDCEDLYIDRSATPPYEAMVPTLPLAWGLPIQQGDETWRQTFFSPKAYDTADSFRAAILWGVHHKNIGKPKAQWCGITEVNSQGIHIGSCPGFLDIDGTYKPSDSFVASVQMNNVHWLNPGNANASKPCPDENGAGGDFHFYAYSSVNGSAGLDKQNDCTFYAPNYDLGPIGYGYPEKAPAAGRNFEDAMRNNPMLAFCRISPQLIQAVATEIARRVAGVRKSAGLYQDPDVSLASVRKVGNAPLIGLSIDESKADDDWPETYPSDGSPPDPGEPPSGYSEPPPPQTGGGNGQSGDGSDDNPGGGTGDGADIDLSHPDVSPGTFAAPDLEMPDWFAGIADLTVPQASGTCPEFGFEAFGTNYRVESHCPFIEEHRAFIASIMVVVFSVAGLTIVMRA